MVSLSTFLLLSLLASSIKNLKCASPGYHSSHEQRQAFPDVANTESSIESPLIKSTTTIPNNGNDGGEELSQIIPPGHCMVFSVILECGYVYKTLRQVQVMTTLVARLSGPVVAGLRSFINSSTTNRFHNATTATQSLAQDVMLFKQEKAKDKFVDAVQEALEAAEMIEREPDEELNEEEPEYDFSYPPQYEYGP